MLPALVGRHKANELLFTCDQIDAQEAHRIGLVNKVVPHPELMPTALAMAEKIAQWPVASIKYTKRAMYMPLANEVHQDAVEQGWRANPGIDGGTITRYINCLLPPLDPGWGINYDTPGIRPLLPWAIETRDGFPLF